MTDDAIFAWLVDPDASDPAIRWQVMLDLLDRPEAEWTAERARVETAPDPRLAEAVEHVRSRRLDDGRWPVDWVPTGRTWFEIDDGEGQPSRWITLRAMRVLRWWEA